MMNDDALGAEVDKVLTPALVDEETEVALGLAHDQLRALVEPLVTKAGRIHADLGEIPPRERLQLAELHDGLGRLAAILEHP